MVGALNLLLYGQEVCTGIFPRVYCGNEDLTNWVILLMLSAERLYWGSRVGLFGVDLVWHSRMIGGIRASRGPVGLTFCRTRGKIFTLQNCSSAAWHIVFSISLQKKQFLIYKEKQYRKLSWVKLSCDLSISRFVLQHDNVLLILRKQKHIFSIHQEN